MIQQSWVGCEAVAISPGRTSGQMDCQHKGHKSLKPWLRLLVAQTAVLSRSALGILSFLEDSGFAAISRESLYANDIGDASQKVGCSGKTRSDSIAIYNRKKT